MNFNLELAPKSTEVVSTWEDALEYCDNLVADDKEGWRLPTIIEMYIIREQYIQEVRLDTKLCDAYVDGSVETPEYWSSSYRIVESEEEPLTVIQTYDFLTDSDDEGFDDYELHVRAVRTIEPFYNIPVELAPQSYIKATSLEEAQMYCFSLNIDGKVGWRFPTPEECYYFNLMHAYFWHSDDIGNDPDETCLIHPVRDL
jgi:hypothetical protein